MSEIRRARRRGQGLRYQDWQFDVTHEAEPSAAVETMISWCKATLSTCRRPHGIDLFDLVVAFRDEAGGAVRSFRLDRLKPLELYQDTLSELLLQRLNEVIHPRASKVYVSAGFFSWGDAAHKALPSQ
jgi:hypothetical protein